MARELQVAREVIGPLRAQYRAVLTAIAERVGLPPAAFESTHSINVQTL